MTESAEEATKFDHVLDAELKPTFDFALEIENRALSEHELVRLFRERIARDGWALLDASA